MKILFIFIKKLSTNVAKVYRVATKINQFTR